MSNPVTRFPFLISECISPWYVSQTFPWKSSMKKLLLLLALERTELQIWYLTFLCVRRGHRKQFLIADSKTIYAFVQAGGKKFATDCTSGYTDRTCEIQCKVQNIYQIFCCSFESTLRQSPDWTAFPWVDQRGRRFLRVVFITVESASGSTSTRWSLSGHPQSCDCCCPGQLWRCWLWERVQVRCEAPDRWADLFPRLSLLTCLQASGDSSSSWRGRLSSPSSAGETSLRTAPATPRWPPRWTARPWLTWTPSLFLPPAVDPRRVRQGMGGSWKQGATVTERRH